MAGGVTRRRRVSGQIALGCAEDWADGRRFFGSSRPCPASPTARRTASSRPAIPRTPRAPPVSVPKPIVRSRRQPTVSAPGRAARDRRRKRQRRGPRPVPPRAMGGAAPRRRCRRVRPTRPVPKRSGGRLVALNPIRRWGLPQPRRRQSSDTMRIPSRDPPRAGQPQSGHLSRDSTGEERWPTA